VRSLSHVSGFLKRLWGNRVSVRAQPEAERFIASASGADGAQPTGVASLFQRALALQQRGDIDNAQTLYRQVVAHQPSHFDAWLLLGVTAIHRHDYLSAVDHLRVACRIDPHHADAHCVLADALSALQRFEEAAACYKTSLTLEPDKVAALTWRSVFMQTWPSRAGPGKS
jgi:Flp pilus assembly protein TadD